MSNSNQQPHPHLVIFPLPIQGPVNSMLNLAHLILSLTQTQSQPIVSITFVNSHFIQHRLDLHSNILARLARFGPRFKFESVSDGLGPQEKLRGVNHITDITLYIEGQAQKRDSRLKEILIGPEGKPVTCIIADGKYGFMVDVAEEIGVPLVFFDTISPCALWTYLCLPSMIQAGELPFQGDDMDALITSVPGMESYLRRRDLPSFCRFYDPTNKTIQLFLKEAHYFPRAQGHILNTFDELEGPWLNHIHVACPNLYAIGPLHLHNKARVHQQTLENSVSSLSSSNSIWQEDRSCLTWLDAQPLRSVLFVSIGSLAIMTKHQLVEFWNGFVDSNVRFLWARRPGSIINVEPGKDCDSMVSAEVLEATKKRGFIVNWAPQDEVLAHPAIGGFLTHSGWNSTLESLVQGVPMICWPFFVDQQVISRVVSEVWEVGLDMKDTCDRVVIKNMVRDLMCSRRDEIAAKVNNLAQLANQAINKGGSSYCNLNRLIDDIQFMRFPKLKPC